MTEGRTPFPLRVLSFFGRRRRFPQTLLRIPRVLVFVAVVTIAAFTAAIAACNPDEWAD